MIVEQVLESFCAFCSSKTTASPSSSIRASLNPCVAASRASCCTAEANSQYQVDEVQKALEDMGYTCKQYGFSDSNDLSSVATTAVSENEVLYVPTDNTVASNAELLNNIVNCGAYSIGMVEMSDSPVRIFAAILPVPTPRS